jgi:cytochrome c oxidase subunit 2
MTLQDEVWWITLAGIGGVVLIFLYVISQTARQAEATQVQARAYAIRRWFFLALIVLGVGVTAATLVPFPIPNQHASSQTRQVVKAVGQGLILVRLRYALCGVQHSAPSGTCLGVSRHDERFH